MIKQIKMLGFMFALVASFSVAENASAGFQGPKTNMPTTVKAAQAAADSTRVFIEGFIVEQTAKEMYVFKDASGTTIAVDIDDEIWPYGGAKATPETKVRIQGEVDKDNKGTEIEVKRIDFVN